MKSAPRHNPPPHVLLFSALDGSGGAGVLADSRAVMRAGALPLSVQTALTAQNLNGVIECWATPPVRIRQQYAALRGAVVGAVKIGVVSAAAASAVAGCVEQLNKGKPPPVVWDPVLSPTMGKAFISGKTLPRIARRLLPLATVITPNRAECLALAAAVYPAFNKKSGNVRTAAGILLNAGVKRVLVTDIKPGPQVRHEMYALANGKPKTTWQTSCRRRRGIFHGTGCFLSSTIAAHLAKGLPPEKSAAAAHRATLQAVDNAKSFPKLGRQLLLG